MENESRPRLRKLFWNLQRGVRPNAQARPVRFLIMYLWQKAAQPHWLKAREKILQARFGSALSIISRPERKRVQIEVACTSRSESRKVVQEFGGRAKRLGRDWLKRLSRAEKLKPLRIGRRLVVIPSPSKREADNSPIV